MKPTHLRCEHVISPLAVSTATPRFSWHNRSDVRGDEQSAYRIIVSEEREAIEKERGLEWDSGKIDSPDQSGVAYAGVPLRSFTRYFWRVGTWDATGHAAFFSQIAHFETGALDPSDWAARWITRLNARTEPSEIHKVSGAINNKSDMTSRHTWALYFAKSFELEERVRRARAYVSGLGYYELSLNGRKVGHHLLDPGQTDYKSGALYSAYEIDELIVAGENDILFTLANGRHIDAYGYPSPRGMVQLLIEFENGESRVIGSDESWLGGYGPIHENGIYLGELYDARDETAIEVLRSRSRGSDIDGENETDIEPAVPAEPVALRPQLMPPIRATRELPPVVLTNPKPGAFVFDFGQNLSGVVRLTMSGRRGTVVTLKYAELVGSDGDLDVGTNREAPASDTYVLKGEGRESFQPRFTYHGFRYLRITGYPGTPTMDDVRAVVLHTDVEQTGAFMCSHALINRIHENTLWSQRSNLMSIPTDCPQRGERMGWLGDAQLASEQAMCNFDMAAFYMKYLEDIRLSQREDGSLSDVTPAYWPLYPADPAWATAYVTLAWQMYFSYGDRRALEEHYDSMRRYVDFLFEQSDGHIIRSLGRYGDWCPPGSIFPKQTPIELTSTWYYYHDTLLFSKIANLLRHAEDGKRYEQRADEILEAFNGEFLRTEGRYATLSMSPIDQSPGQTSQALPLYLDMVPEEDRASAVETLVDTIERRFDCHVDTGIVGTRYLFEVLRNEGRADLAYRMITQESYPGWGYMIGRGATTIWERWEDLRGLGMNSHNHIMLGSVDAWFYRTLAGIRQTGPLWRQVLIEPHPIGGLRHASGRVGTLYGEIAVEWHTDNGELALDVTIPVGTKARVRIPRGGPNDRLFESGESIEALAAEGYHELEVGSGTYHFERKGA